MILKLSSLLCYWCYNNYSHEKMYRSKHSKTCYRLAIQSLLRRNGKILSINPIKKQEFFSLLPLTSLMFNSCDNSVQVSFIPGCHRLMPVLADYPSLSHVVYSSVTVRQNILAIIPVYNLGRGSVNHYEVVVKAVVLLCRQSKLAIISLQIACISVQKRIRIFPKSG